MISNGTTAIQWDILWIDKQHETKILFQDFVCLFVCGGGVEGLSFYCIISVEIILKHQIMHWSISVFVKKISVAFVFVFCPHVLKNTHTFTYSGKYHSNGFNAKQTRNKHINPSSVKMSCSSSLPWSHVLLCSVAVVIGYSKTSKVHFSLLFLNS